MIWIMFAYFSYHLYLERYQKPKVSLVNARLNGTFQTLTISMLCSNISYDVILINVILKMTSTR
jgi:hypothetical protein